MSGWNLPQSLNAIQQEANADFGALYQNLTNTFAEANQHFGEVNQHLADATQQLTDAHTEIAEREVEVTTLQTQLALEQQATPPPPQNPPPPINQAPLQRFQNMPDPEKFNGDRSKFPDFLTQMHLKLMANGD
jgi:hypothetical protein